MKRRDKRNPHQYSKVPSSFRTGVYGCTLCTPQHNCSVTSSSWHCIPELHSDPPVLSLTPGNNEPVSFLYYFVIILYKWNHTITYLRSAFSLVLLPLKSIPDVNCINSDFIVFFEKWYDHPGRSPQIAKAFIAPKIGISIGISCWEKERAEVWCQLWLAYSYTPAPSEELSRHHLLTKAIWSLSSESLCGPPLYPSEVVQQTHIPTRS